MYKSTESNSIIRLSDNAIIPIANGNRDYQEYLEWLNQGNVPEPAFTEAELKAREDAETIVKAKQYLSSTDWIVTKITEASVKGDNVTDMLSKYSAELAERALKRELINSLEG